MSQAAHPLDAIAGTWRGTGEGSYPTIADFAYNEELVITPVPGKPLARWASTTRDASSGEPRLRRVQLPAVNANGHRVRGRTASASSKVGDWDAGRRRAQSVDHPLHGTPTAKTVDHVDRRYEVDNDALRYTVSMAAVGVELTHHLAGSLGRVT